MGCVSLSCLFVQLFVCCLIVQMFSRFLRQAKFAGRGPDSIHESEGNTTEVQY